MDSDWPPEPYPRFTPRDPRQRRTALRKLGWKILQTLALVSGIAYAIVTYLQWRDINENFKIDERAWIALTKIMLTHMQAPDPINVSISIVNSGRTPALGISEKCILHAAEGLISIDRYAENPVEKAGGPVSSFTLFPSVRMELPVATGYTDALGIESVNNGKTVLYAFCTIEYSDIFKAIHHTRFCGRYLPDAKAFGACNSYNFAD